MMLRTSICLLFSLLLCVAAKSQQASVPKEEGYEMKQYYVAVLTKGPKRGTIKDTAYVKKLQADHLKNIDRLAAEGKILVAGPFADDGHWRGMFIMDCATREEAVRILATDPMIAAEWLAYELHPWFTAKNCVFK